MQADEWCPEGRHDKLRPLLPAIFLPTYSPSQVYINLGFLPAVAHSFSFLFLTSSLKLLSFLRLPSSSSLTICSFTSCSFFKHSSLSLSPLVGFDSCCLLMCAAPSPFLILCFVILLCLRSQAGFTKQTASPEWNLNLNFELWATLFTLRENLPSDEATVYTRKCSHAYLHRHTPSRYCHLSSFLNISFYSERNIVWCMQCAARDHCEPQS